MVIFQAVRDIYMYFTCCYMYIGGYIRMYSDQKKPP